MEQTVLATVREILAGPSARSGVIELDELTGLYAASVGVRRLAEEVGRAIRYRHPLSCVLLEVDGLEAVTQEHGPGRSDRVLQDVGSILRHAARPADIVSRLEGGCFLIITPRLDARAAQAQAERSRQRLARHRFPIPGGPALTLTASCAVASVGEESTSAEALLQEALELLATAKTAGGNQTVSR